MRPGPVNVKATWLVAFGCRLRAIAARAAPQAGCARHEASSARLSRRRRDAHGRRALERRCRLVEAARGGVGHAHLVDDAAVLRPKGRSGEQGLEGGLRAARLLGLLGRLDVAARGAHDGSSSAETVPRGAARPGRRHRCTSRGRSVHDALLRTQRTRLPSYTPQMRRHRLRSPGRRRHRRALALACAATRAVTPSATPPAARPCCSSATASPPSNELAARVAAIAAAAGRPLRTSAVTISGASLLDHWQDGRARQAIRDGRWDVVAMQQGPSTLPESRAELIASTRQFAAEIRAAGGRPALLMVWPLPGQAAAAVSASYRAAAEANDALLLPAGDAWTKARQTDAALVLTQDDGFHPSLLGTWLAALTVRVHALPAGPRGAGAASPPPAGWASTHAVAISSSRPPAGAAALVRRRSRRTMHEIPLLINIAVALAAALVGGLVARRAHVPPLVGYLVAGMAIGPFTPGLPGRHRHHQPARGAGRRLPHVRRRPALLARATCGACAAWPSRERWARWRSPPPSATAWAAGGAGRARPASCSGWPSPSPARSSSCAA